MVITSIGIYSYELYLAYNVENIIRIGTTISAVPSFKLLKKADEIVNKLGLQDKTRFGKLLTTDVFYNDCPNTLDWIKMGVIGVEMKAYGLYLNAARAGKNALGYLFYI